MANIFFTADLHFDHKNILAYTNRPWNTLGEMNQGLVDNWNSVVGKKDMTYVVGDFAWRNHASWFHRLNGKKILIRGNHDKMNQKCLALWTEVHDLKWIQVENHHMLLCHYQLVSWPGEYRGAWHFYGHAHARAREFDDLAACDVGIDCWDYTPVPWEVLKAKMQDKEPRLHNPEKLEIAKQRALKLFNTNKLYLDKYYNTSNK